MNKMSLSALILRMASLLLLLLLIYRADAAKVQIIASTVDFQVGTKMTLLCRVEREGELKWLKDGDDVDEDYVINIDETHSKLVIGKTTMEDAGLYTCECDEYSDKDEKRVYIHDGPHFAQTPTLHEFLEGSRGWVPCEVTGKPGVTVQWLRHGKEISSSEGTRVRHLPNNTLFFDNVTRDDDGAYICMGQIQNRPSVSNSLSISVVVTAPPVVHLKERETKVMAGSETNVSLLCLVDGRPKPTITWTMPVPMDPSHFWFNSDRSQLTIMSVMRADYGEYVCTATNKLGNNSGAIMLHVHEAPEVSLSSDQQSKSVGDRVSVFCNVSGHPPPKLFWFKKHTEHTVDSQAADRVRVDDGSLIIEEVVPSDGGVYSCMALGATGNASRDFTLRTEPGVPYYLSVYPGPSSVLFSIKVKPDDGGTPITNFVLQWRENEAEHWQEITIPASDPLSIANLKQYTNYTVRLAAMNEVGTGQFSAIKSIRTLGKREPDSPVLSAGEMKVEKNSFTVPLQLSDEGVTPLLYYTVRYKQNKEDAEWVEIQLPPEADAISLKDLPFGADYQLEVTAVNGNGSSVPAMSEFTVGAQPLGSLTKGSVVGIVLMIFLVVFLVVDASCCYRNRCGLLMTIGVKLFGQKVPGLKMLEDGEAANNGEIKLNGIPTPMAGTQTLSKEPGQLTEVTCDKASLTKHEKSQPGREQHHADA